MSSTVKLPGPLDRSSARAASVMAWRVAALFSSRRDGPSDGGSEAGGTAALGDREVETDLHYVQVCTQGKLSESGTVADLHSKMKGSEQLPLKGPPET